MADEPETEFGWHHVATDAGSVDVAAIEAATQVLGQQLHDLETAHFPALNQLHTDFENMLAAWFDKQKLPPGCTDVALVALWLGLQVAQHGVDLLKLGDFEQTAPNQVDAETQRKLWGQVKSDWRTSAVVNVAMQMLSAMRAQQLERGELPEDLQRIVTAQRTAAGVVQ